MKAIQPDSGEDLTIQAGVSRTQVWQRADLTAAESDWLADEVPVALVYNGISHVVMMTTPKDLEAFALGFSLSEGIIDAPGDIFGMDIVPGCHGIEVQIELSSRRFMALKEQRRALAGRTGCGVCGVEQLDQIGKPLSPLPFTQTFALDQLDRALGQLKAYQPVGQKTGCTHAATWIQPDGQLAGEHGGGDDGALRCRQVLGIRQQGGHRRDRERRADVRGAQHRPYTEGTVPRRGRRGHVVAVPCQGRLRWPTGPRVTKSRRAPPTLRGRSTAVAAE